MSNQQYLNPVGGVVPGGGDVSGPSSSIDGDIAIFSGTTGKVINDSGFSIDYLNSMGLGFYGDGSDGSVTFDGTTTILGIVPSANAYTLVRDLFLSSSTINSGVSIITNGFKLFCNGTLTNNGSISWNGNNGAASITAGVALTNTSSTISNSTGTSAPGTAGGAGATGSGSAGASSSIGKNFGGAGGAGGVGGSAGGSGGTKAALLTTFTPPRTLASLLSTVFIGSLTSNTISGGIGGGGGGGDGSVAGGGGGSGGGIVIVYSFKFAGTGTIRARGGNGGSPISGTNCGGGGGGGGGIIIIVSRSIIANAITGQTIDANGGIGGTGFGSGSNGTNGNSGIVILLQN